MTELKPPERWEELLLVVRNHFPNLGEDDICDPKGLGRKVYSVFALVNEADDDLRRCCARIATYGADLDQGSLKVEFGLKHRPTAVLRGLAKALERGDREAYAKWLRQETVAVRKLVVEAKADITGEEDWTISEFIEQVVGPFRSQGKDSWLIALYRRAAEIASKPGRRPNEWQDEAAVRCVELWSMLSGLPIRQPSHVPGASARAGKMIPFVQDALAVYRDFGLLPAPDSGAAWARIIGKLSETSPTA